VEFRPKAPSRGRDGEPVRAERRVGRAAGQQPVTTALRSPVIELKVLPARRILPSGRITCLLTSTDSFAARSYVGVLRLNP
jgi:hypothetical protein